MIILGRILKTTDVVFAALVFVLFLGILFMLFGYYFRPPRITSITPVQVKTGDTIIITGKNFGKAGVGGKVYISSQQILSRHYQSWSDTEIHIAVHNTIPSGFLTVVTPRGKSNLHLISHVDILVEPMSAYTSGSDIVSVEPTEISIADSVTLSGIHFGDEQYNYEIGFVHPKNNDILIPVENIIWSDTEISFTVPDGIAQASSIRLDTAQGGVETDVTVFLQGGNKVYGEGYAVNLEYTIYFSYVRMPDTLVIWIPHPKISAAQPQVSNLQGGNTLRIRPTTGQSYTKQFTVLRYSVHTTIRPQDVQQSYTQDMQSYLKHAVHKDTLADIAAFVQNTIKQEKNPYYKAMYLFQALVEHMQPLSGAFAFSTITESFERGSGGSFDYAALYAEALRLAGVPARLVFGVLVNKEESRSHAWVEFFLEGLGWLPTDPALADGMHNDISGLFSDKRQYFGNLDALHIEFDTSLPPYPLSFEPVSDPTATFIYNSAPDFAPRPIQGYFHGDGRFFLSYEQPTITSIITTEGQ